MEPFVAALTGPCENLVQAVIPGRARNLALNILKAVRDSSSPAAPRNDRPIEFSHGLSRRGPFPAAALRLQILKDLLVLVSTSRQKQDDGLVTRQKSVR